MKKLKRKTVKNRKIRYAGNRPQWMRQSVAFLSVVVVISLTYSLFHQYKETAPAVSQSLPYTVPIQQVRIPILIYHYVENVKNKRDRIRNIMNVRPDIFESQIKALRDNGYTFMTAGEIAQVLNGMLTLPPKPVAITIDDGHWDLYTDIVPILKKYHAKATAYIIPGFIGGPDFLTPDQLSSVIDSGLVEIGAHTMHHIELANKLLPVVQYEVVQSKATLEKVYGVTVASFAYPSGSFDSQASNAVKAAGFTSAVTTISGISQSYDRRFSMERIRPGNRAGNELLWYIQEQYLTNKNTPADGIKRTNRI